MIEKYQTTRRRFARSAVAGAASIGAPLPLRWALAQSANLKVALLVPIVGPHAGMGEGAQHAADVANDVFADMKIGVRLENTAVGVGATPETAAAAANKAIDAGAHVLVGAFDSAQTLAIARVAEQRHVPLIVNVGSAPPITESGFRYVVRNFPNARMLIVGAFDMQKEIFKRSGTTPKRAGLLNVSDMFGKAIVDAFKARFSELAMPYELVGAVTYEPDLVELPRGVAKAKELNIDLFMPLCRGPDAKIIIQEMVKQDWQPLGIITPASPGLYDQDFLKSMGKNADYHISTLPWLDPKSAMTESLRKHHAARFPGAQLDINGGFTFEAMLVAAHGWLAARSTRGDSLIDALRKVKIDQHVITGGPIQFDEKGQNTNITTAAVQNLNRTPTIVLPDEWATAKLVFPEPGWKDPRRT